MTHYKVVVPFPSSYISNLCLNIFSVNNFWEQKMLHAIPKVIETKTVPTVDSFQKSIFFVLMNVKKSNNFQTFLKYHLKVFFLVFDSQIFNHIEFIKNGFRYFYTAPFCIELYICYVSIYKMEIC